MPHLEIAEVVLVHFNIVNNDYQQDSRVLYMFVRNKTFNSEYEEIKLWFTDENSD